MLLSSLWRRDPGPCPICGAPHTACTTDTAHSLIVPQLPARDASAPAVVAPLRAETLQATLPAGQFTTGTYRGGTNPRRRRR